MGEFPEKISPQVKFPIPLTQIDIKNNETRYKLQDVLKTTMSLLLQIQTDSINGQIKLQDFTEKFAINTSNLNLKKEEIKLENLMHIYEIIEDIEMKTILKDDQELNHHCMLSDAEENYTRLRANQKAEVHKFC